MSAELPDEGLEFLETEAIRPELAELDLAGTAELVALVLADQHAVDAALAQGAQALAEAVDAVAARMRSGGRLIYLGAGTSGRLAAMDAAEIPATFGTDPDLVVAVTAGGAAALSRAREATEDDADAAALALAEIGVGASDSVVGIAASGRTPFVLGGLRAAHEAGALTISVANNVGAAVSRIADIAIELPTGAELIAGSTRLKAGTAQKVVLGALSTLVMVRLGRTYGNLMVDMEAGNAKLRDRARRLVAAATGCDDATAAAILGEAGGSVKVAVVMHLAGVDTTEARRRLAGGASVREAAGG